MNSPARACAHCFWVGGGTWSWASVECGISLVVLYLTLAESLSLSHCTAMYMLLFCSIQNSDCFMENAHLQARIAHLQFSNSVAAPNGG